MKRLLAITLLLCGIVKVTAATDIKLILWKTDGNKEIISLEEKPITTFTQDEILIKTSRVTITYPKSEVSKYTYEGIPNGIDNIGSNNNGIYFNQEGNTIVVSNYSKDSYIYIYTTGGLTKSIIESKHGSSSQISLEDYPNGVYIIKINNATYKFLKK